MMSIGREFQIVGAATLKYWFLMDVKQVCARQWWLEEKWKVLPCCHCLHSCCHCQRSTTSISADFQSRFSTGGATSRTSSPTWGSTFIPPNGCSSPDTSLPDWSHWVGTYEVRKFYKWPQAAKHEPILFPKPCVCQVAELLLAWQAGRVSGTVRSRTREAMDGCIISNGKVTFKY